MRPAEQAAVCFSNKNLIIIVSSRNIITTVPENLSKIQLLDADIIIVLARLLEDPS